MRGARARARAGAVADEAGFTALWFMGLVLALLIVCGVGLDLWRIYSERTGMAAAVDAAADAGAAQIDEAAFRGGRMALDPDRAEEAARENLADQSDGRRLSSVEVDVAPERITVQGEGFVRLTLLRLVVPEPIRVVVTAVAEPRTSR